MATKPQIFYSDLSLNPIITSKGDVSVVVNGDAITQAITMLLNTEKGTRIFMPDYGCRVKGFLFETFEQTTATRIGNEISECLQNYEQRIQVLNINVIMVEQNTSYDVNISYSIVNTQVVNTYQITLEKLS